MSCSLRVETRESQPIRAPSHIALTFLTIIYLAPLPSCSNDGSTASSETGGNTSAGSGGKALTDGGSFGSGASSGNSGGRSGGGSSGGEGGGTHVETGGREGAGGSGSGGSETSNGGVANSAGGFGGASGGDGGADPGGTNFDFSSDTEGWTAGFCDYPEGEEEFYKLDFGWAQLPEEVSGGGGLRITGSNHSDDLFMYISRPITGLLPNNEYILDITVDIATNAPAECGGIGGSPGVSVYFKIGASSLEPNHTVDDLGHLRLNLDKGNQAIGGSDLVTVGDIGNSRPCQEPYEYEPKRLMLSDFSARTSVDGTLWIVVGTDSGFEGLTTLYYDRVQVVIR